MNIECTFYKILYVVVGICIRYIKCTFSEVHGGEQKNSIQTVLYILHFSFENWESIFERKIVVYVTEIFS